MNYKSFAERTKDKTFDELVHEGKRRAHELIEDQGIAALALYIADIMSKNVEFRQKPVFSEKTGFLYTSITKVVWETWMLNDYLVLSKDNIEVRYTEGDKPFAEETFIALKEALVSLSNYFCLKEPFPKIRAILVPNRNEFDRLVIDLLGVEIETPSRPTRMAQPQKTDLVVLSPSAYKRHSTFKYFPDEYKRLLFHEITHMFEEYLAPTSAMETVPRWWSEGLAAYLSGQWKYEDQYRFRQPVLKGIKEKLIPNLKDIQASIELCYDWGWTIVIFIENTYGKEFILQIVKECDNGNVFGIFGEDFKNFEKIWKEWLLYANVVYEVNPSSHI